MYQGGEEDLKVGVRYPILSVTPIRFAVISCTRILVGRVRDFSAVFFAIGTVISTYIDNTKTALIVAFAVWVFAVLIAPRVGFIAAKIIVPTQTLQSVYLEKTAARENINAEKREIRYIKRFGKTTLTLKVFLKNRSHWARD